MIIAHKSISRQGIKANEDYAYSCEQFIFVADGATGLTDKKYTSHESDARWFAQRLGVLLQERLHDMSRTINDIVSEVTSELSTEYNELLSGDVCDTLDMPSAGISILRINGETLEHFQLGDCMALIIDKYGVVKKLFNESLTNLDNEVIRNMVDISREKNIPISETLVFVKDQLICNRRKLNKPGGYWILDPTGIGIKHALESKFSVKDVKSFAVMSDGFYEIVDLFKLYDYKTLMEKMCSNSLERLYDELYQEQEADPTLDKYPRFKLRDDASVAWCGL